MATQASRPRLLGRADETATLSEALDRVASGRLAVALLEGEAGIGKTRLLEHALTDAQARGMQVVAGRAGELERNRPFGLLASAFGCTASSPDPRRAAIAALLAIHGGDGSEPITVTSDPGLQFRAVDAFGDLVEELALAGPVVIGVDDLQWADPSSLLTLGAVGRRFAYPVGLIGCFRPSPRVADLERLVDALEAAGALHLRVSPLADGAVRDLVAETVAAEPGAGLLAEISGTAGNPLFIIELIGALLQEGTIQTADGQADVARGALPPTLRLTIMRRLSFLSDDTLRALRPAAILGSRFTLADLATVTSQPAVDLSLWAARGDQGARSRRRRRQPAIPPRPDPRCHLRGPPRQRAPRAAPGDRAAAGPGGGAGAAGRRTPGARGDAGGRRGGQLADPGRSRGRVHLAAGRLGPDGTGDPPDRSGRSRPRPAGR